MRPVSQSSSVNPRVTASLPFVEQLARRVAATMPHSIDIGDLVQDGVIGLIDAAHRFDEARGIKFETFAERRIRGAMIDALRKDAWPRGVRRQRRELEAAREELRRELGHEPSLADLAAKIGSDEKRLGRTIVRINAIESTSPLANNENLDESTLPTALIPSEPEQPDDAYERQETKERVCAAIASLPPREQKVISLYYYGEATMKQIGAEIGVNESRVSQLHARAIRRLRDALGSMMPAGRSDEGDAQRDPRVPETEDGEGHAAQRAHGERGRAAWCGGRLRERLADVAQQVGEPEGLGQPAAAALLEKAFRLWSGDRSSDEDHAARERGRRGCDRAIERHAVNARHLEIADHDVVTILTHAGEGLLAIARVINSQARLGQRFDDGCRQRPFILDQQYRRAVQRAASTRGRTYADGAAFSTPLTGNSTVNDAPPAAGESTRMLPPCSWTIAYATVRPSPVPFPTSFVVKNGSKILPFTL